MEMNSPWAGCGLGKGQTGLWQDAELEQGQTRFSRTGGLEHRRTCHTFGATPRPSVNSKCFWPSVIWLRVSIPQAHCLGMSCMPGSLLVTLIAALCSHFMLCDGDLAIFNTGNQRNQNAEPS